MVNNEKWCFIAFDINKNVDVGIYKKVCAQKGAISRVVGNCDILLINKECILFCADGCEEYSVLTYEETSLKNLLCIYDFVYARWGGVNSHFVELLSKKEELKCKLVVEIPTYPIKQELWGKAVLRLRRGQLLSALRSFFGGFYLQDILLRRQKNKFDYVVLVSYPKDIKKDGCIHIENGIDINAITKSKVKNKGEKIIMMIVANIEYWHGIDRVIEGIHLYDNKDKIEFRIVGDGLEKSSLEQLVSDYNLESTVKFLGIKTGNELDLLFDECDIAIGSIGMSRKKIQGSTLKTREYMARGVPFVVSTLESIGDDITKYLYVVEDDDSVIDIKSVMEFVNKIDRIEASRHLRQYSEVHCSWDNQIRKVIENVMVEE